MQRPEGTDWGRRGDGTAAPADDGSAGTPQTPDNPRERISRSIFDEDARPFPPTRRGLEHAPASGWRIGGKSACSSRRMVRTRRDPGPEPTAGPLEHCCPLGSAAFGAGATRHGRFPLTEWESPARRSYRSVGRTPAGPSETASRCERAKPPHMKDAAPEWLHHVLQVGTQGKLVWIFSR